MAQLYTQNGPFGTNQVVIPQITIPNGIQRYEPLTAANEEVARSMRLPPSVRVPIFDETKEVFYQRETDASGNTVVFDVYSYSKVEPPPPPQYATVQDLAAVLEEVKSLREDLRNGKFVRSKDYSRSDNGNQNKQPAAESK